MNNGRLRTVVGSAPAPGAEVSEIVPAGEIWEIVSVRVVLVSDATAVTRNVMLTLTDGTSLLLKASADEGQGPSSTRNYTHAHYGVNGTSEDEVFVTIPPGLVLYPGYVLATATENLQAADQFGAPVFNILQQ